MKKIILNKGFTLLELLMVILVIGILSSFAVPEYISAQEKAFGAEAQIFLKRMVKSEEMFWLENDRFTSNMNLLDEDYPDTNNWTFAVHSVQTVQNPPNHQNYVWIKATRLNGPWAGTTVELLYRRNDHTLQWGGTFDPVPNSPGC